jgi:hypothetical protein
MIMIDKSIIDNNINYDNIKTIDNLENKIMNYVYDNNFNGYVVKKSGNINYYFLINKILKL